MKKILKRLLISTALITPIVVSTPLLLTSCSTDVEMSETGPSIFKGPYGLELFEDKENTGEPKGYYLDTTLKSDVTSNNIINSLLKVVPNSPKFNVLASERVKQLTGFTNLKENTELQLPSDEEWQNGVNYSEFKLENLKLNEAGKIEAIKNILTGFTFEHRDNEDVVISEYPITAFDFDSFKDQIVFDVSLTVSEYREYNKPSNSTEKPVIINRKILSEISFTFKLIDTSKKWARLQTGDPIFISINWTENPKSTLFTKGFAEKNPQIIEITEGSNKKKTINFTGTLNQSVFGADASKIDNTGKIKQWLQGITGGGLNSTADNSINADALTTANKNLPSKINDFFSNINGNITNPGIAGNATKAGENAINIPQNELITSFVKNVPESNGTIKVNPTPILGNRNIDVTISKISKASDGNRKFNIELEFKLINENDPGWYGLTGEASKLPIKLILDVTTTAATGSK